MPAGVFFERYEKDMAFVKWPIHKVALALGLATIYLWPLALPNDYLMRLAVWMAAWAVSAAGLNVLFGLAGQISLAQGAFMALGAFTSIHLVNLGIPFPLALPIAGLMVAAVGTLFGLPSLRLKELYLLISTLAAQLFIDWLLRTDSMAWFSGGAYAILAPAISIGPFTADTPYEVYLVMITVAAVHLAFVANIGRSYIGRAMKAVRDRDIAAEIIGVNVFKYKLIAFAISAYMAAVGGAMWAFTIRSVNVESFTIMTSIEVLAAVLIGGLGRVVWGSLLGSMFVIGIPEAIKVGLFQLGIRGIDIALRDLIFGSLIVAFLLFEPLGVTELLRKVKERIRLFPFRYY